MSPRSFAIVAGLFALANAFTQPKAQTWGPLLTPDLTHSVTQGESFTVTWDPAGHPTDGVTVSLVLCNGPSTNCVTQNSAIAEGIPAGQKSFAWSVPCSLPTGTQGTSSGYGMLIIVDGTGEFQFSTQFSVLAGSKCGGGSGSSSSTTSAPGSSTTSAPPSSSTTSAHGGGGYGDSTTHTVVTETSTTSSVIDTVTIHNSYTHSDGSASSATQSSQPGPSSVAVDSSVTLSTVTSGFASATPATTTASSSAFTGAAARATGGVLGLVAGGALAMLAL